MLLARAARGGGARWRVAGGGARRWLAVVVRDGDGAVVAKDVVLDALSVREYVSKYPAAQREAALVRACETGAFVLLRAGAAPAGEELAAALKGHLERDVSAAVEALLARSLVASDGKLGEVKTLVDAVDTLLKRSLAASDGKLNDVKRLIESEVDPSRRDSTLGRALDKIEGLLDARRSDSVPGVIQAQMAASGAADGPLARAVRGAVEAQLAPLREQLAAVGRAVEQQGARAQLADQTTLKGLAFEEQVVESLNLWRRAAGATVERCGADNRQGDVLVRMPDGPTVPGLGGGLTYGGGGGGGGGGGPSEEGARSGELLIVLEAKNVGSRMGRSRVSSILAGAVEARGAQVGVLVAKDAQSAFAGEVGEWDEGWVGGKHWIACTLESLQPTLRYAWLVHRAQQVQHAQRALSDARHESALDVAAVRAALDDARTNLKRCAQVKSKATSIRKFADQITDTTQDMEKTVKESLAQIENLLATQAEAGAEPETEPAASGGAKPPRKKKAKAEADAPRQSREAAVE
jgi:hypothetical protein